MASAITALFTFIGNYLLLFPRKGIQPFLTEILKILVERVFVTISLSRTGLDPNVLWADWKTKFLDVVNFHATLRTRHARVKKAPSLNQFRIKERHARS